MNPADVPVVVFGSLTLVVLLGGLIVAGHLLQQREKRNATKPLPPACPICEGREREAVTEWSVPGVERCGRCGFEWKEE